MNYVDYESIEVKLVIESITHDGMSDEEKLERLLLYVRDDIKFGFLPEGDFVKASEIIRRKLGQCNNKSILFHGLCKAANIQSRIRFSTIRKDIQSGLFRGWIYALMGDEISHSWLEVKINNRWHQIDGYINDQAFYLSGKERLKKEHRTTGYSISCDEGASSIELDLHGDSFVQMGAVVEKQEAYDDPSEYFESDLYKNNLSELKMWFYRRAIIKINKRICKMRMMVK